MAIFSTLLAAMMLFGGTAGAVTQPDVIPFGDTFQGTRSTITVTQPEPFTPSDYVPVEGDRAVKASVTVANEGSDVMQRYDFYASATCGGRAAPPIFDFENGLVGSGPPGDILPGRMPGRMPGHSVSWELGFWLPQDTCELIVTVQYTDSSIYFFGDV